MKHFLWLPAALFASAIALVNHPASASTICATQIDSYLTGTPMAGEGAHFVKWGQYFNVDPRLVVGIANAESTLGRNCCGSYDAWGWACPQTFSSGYDPYTADAKYSGCPGWVSGKGIYFETAWEDGIFFVTRDMRWYYIDKGYNTVAKIQPKYCTSGCTYWVSNVTDAFAHINSGDVNALDFPGIDCGVPPACNADLNNLYVTFLATSTCGSSADPMGSLLSALTKVNGGGTININNSGSVSGTLNPNGKTVLLKPTNGSITLSQ